MQLFHSFGRHRLSPARGERCGSWRTRWSLLLSIAALCAGPAAGTIYSGIDFPQGAASFADRVIDYDPSFGGGSRPPSSPNFNDPDQALGVPDYTGGADGEGAVALGKGGKIELLFRELILTNSGDSTADLAVFEVGPSAERVSVGVRPANPATRASVSTLCVDTVPLNDDFCTLGTFPGGTMQIDIDTYFPTFAPDALRFDAVQIIDDAHEGNHTGSAPGADIDAVGTIRAGATVCGDGNVEGGEDCDDGALAAGDGCGPSCLLEPCWACQGEPSLCVTLPDGAACEDGDACTTNDYCANVVCIGGPPATCDDQNVCTDDSCSPGSGCVHAPNTGPCDDGSTCSINEACSGGACVGEAVVLTGCRQSGATLVFLKDRDPDTADAFFWKWKKGAATALDEFDDPPGGSDTFEVCVFDRTGGTDRLRLSAAIPSGGACGRNPCWKARGSKGFVYKNRDLTYGIRTILLKSGGTGRAAIRIKGKGEHLAMPALPLSGRVKVQFKNADVCWEADYSTPVLNRPSEFKARN